MSAKPMTKKEWLAYLEEAMNTFDWEDAREQQPADEPVAWMRTSGTGSPVVTEELLIAMPEMRWNFQQPLRPQSAEPVIDESAAKRIATALGWAPKREWVGLTDEETTELVHRYAFYNLAREIESKLKEKNT